MTEAIFYTVVAIVVALHFIIEEVRTNKHEKTKSDFGSFVFVISIAWPVVGMLFACGYLTELIDRGFVYVIDKLKGR